jgi:hypothetical protein
MIEESEVSEMIKQMVSSETEPVSRDDFKRYYLEK